MRFIITYLETFLIDGSFVFFFLFVSGPCCVVKANSEKHMYVCIHPELRLLNDIAFSLFTPFLVSCCNVDNFSIISPSHLLALLYSTVLSKTNFFWILYSAIGCCQWTIGAPAAAPLMVSHSNCKQLPCLKTDTAPVSHNDFSSHS